MWEQDLGYDSPLAQPLLLQRWSHWMVLLLQWKIRSSHHGSVATNPVSTHEDSVQSLALLSGLRIQHCRELWCRSRCGSDLLLLGLWCRLAAAALIRPLAWEFPYATDAALTPPAKKVAFLEHYPHFWSPLNSILLESFNWWGAHSLTR